MTETEKDDEIKRVRQQLSTAKRELKKSRQERILLQQLLNIQNRTTNNIVVHKARLMKPKIIPEVQTKVKEEEIETDFTLRII